jgi:hypothetical protein
MESNRRTMWQIVRMWRLNNKRCCQTETFDHDGDCGVTVTLGLTGRFLRKDCWKL